MTLSAPKCIGLSPIKPFLIRIKELPHIRDSTIRYTHFCLVGCIEIIAHKPCKSRLNNSDYWAFVLNFVASKFSLL